MDTPLHVAAGAGQYEVVLALVSEYGCDPNMVNRQGQTSLHYACAGGDADLVHVLIDKQADLSIRDNEKDTPFHVAVENYKLDP